MFLVLGGDVGGHGVVRRFHRRKFLRPLDALFDIAHRGEVFIELALIVSAEFGVEILGVFANEVEDALPFLVLRCALGRRLGRKEPLEHYLGADFFRQWLCRGSPRHGGRINTAITGVAIARHRAVFATELKRRETSLVREPGSRDLIDRDTSANVGTVGLLWLRACEECTESTSMVAAAISVWPCLIGRETRQHEKLLTDRFERFEDCG